MKESMMRNALLSIERGLVWVEKGLTILSCSVMCIILLLQVLFRYVFQISAVWTEEIALITFLYTIFLGASLVVVQSKHIGFDALVALFPKKFNSVVWIISNIAVMVFLAVMIFSGYKLVVAGRTDVSPMLRIPMSWLYTIIPVSGATMFLHTLSGFLREVKSQFSETEETGKGG
jgi:TRAP-type C4-dicarboxylate transport system permease small subunit